MDKFTTLTGHMVAIPTENIDTDQIIPAQFLKTITKKGLGENLFFHWRYNEDGSPNMDFPLNQPEAKGAEILLAGDNFGCGSSREHAPWSLTDFGFRAIISTSFADIFRNNSLKNSLLPVIVDEDTYQQLASLVAEEPDTSVTINLADQTLTLPDGRSVTFPIHNFSKTCMLEGLDQLGYLQKQDALITNYETTHPARVDVLS